jgi:cobalt/nickel transport system permease protein
MVALFSVLMCISLQPGHLWPLAAFYFFAITLALVWRISLWHVARRVLTLAPFLLICGLFLPFSGKAGGQFVSMMAKGFFSILVLSIYAEKTPIPETLQALAQLGCPKLFLMLAGFIQRYAGVMTEEIARMRRACACRMYRDRWLWHARFLGGLVGMLFLRGYERGERVYLAMVSRGYDGEWGHAQRRAFHFADWLFVAGAAAILIACRIVLP